MLWRRIAHSNDTASRTRTQAWLGPILIRAGPLELAAKELKGAPELPADADPAARAELLAKLARVEYRLDHNERGSTWPIRRWPSPNIIALSGR